MQSEKTGKYIEINKIKVKDNSVIIEYKEDESIKKIKILYSTYETHPINEGELETKEFLFLLNSDKENKIKKYVTNLMVKKLYSKKDIKLKCFNKFCDYDKELVIQVIDDLEDQKIIDDKEFVLTYLEYFNSSYYGKYYIINYFKEKNIDDEIIKSLSFDDEEEKKKARKYFELIKNKYVSSNYIKQKKKISDAMLKRGFDFSIINEVIKDIKVDKEKENKIFIKDYLKTKDKYSKIENKSIRKAKIVSSLVNKGYQFKTVIEYINNDIEGENDD